MIAGERELVERVLTGDEAAFNLIMEAYQQRLFRLALRMTRNREDAEEVLQEAFLSAFFNLRSFKWESSLYTWLYAITLRLGMKRGARQVRQAGRTTSLQEMVHDPVATGPAPDSTSLDREIAEHIDRAIVNLPRQQRAVFVLRHQEQLTFKEVAQHLGKSEGGVKALYFHAVRKLRRALEPLRRRVER